jgi:hypothetical protein
MKAFRGPNPISIIWLDNINQLQGSLELWMGSSKKAIS